MEGTFTDLGRPFQFSLAATWLMGLILLSLLVSPLALLAVFVVVPMILFFRPAVLPYLVVAAVCSSGLFVVSDSELGAGLASTTLFHVTFADAVLLAGMAAFVAHSALSGWHWLPWSRVDTAICVVTAATALSGLLALSRGTGAVAVVQTLEFWMLARLVAQSIERSECVRSFYRFFIFVALLELGIGFCQYVSAAENPFTREPVISGTFGSSFLFGLFLGWAAMIAYTQFLAAAQAGMRRLAWLVAFFILVSMVLLSGKRSQWLALTVTIFVLTAVRSSKQAWLAALLFVVAGVGLLSIPPIRQVAMGKVQQAIRYEDVGTQGYSRLRLVQTSWQLFTAQPWLGIGPKNFRFVSERYLASQETGGYRVLATEQWLVGKLAEQGMVGYAAFLYLTYVLLSESKRLLARGDSLDPVAATLFGFFVYIVAELGEWFGTERGHINFVFVGFLMAASYLRSRAVRPSAIVNSAPHLN
jgi:O-antigen ligase